MKSITNLFKKCLYGKLTDKLIITIANTSLIYIKITKPIADKNNNLFYS